MLVANSRFPYRQKMLEAGEEFEPESERDAEILKLAGKASLKEDEGQTKRAYKRRDMKAEQ